MAKKVVTPESCAQGPRSASENVTCNSQSEVLHRLGIYDIVDANGEFVAKLRNDAEGRAIAATPAMLAALKGLLSAVQSLELNPAVLAPIAPAMTAAMQVVSSVETPRN